MWCVWGGDRCTQCGQQKPASRTGRVVQECKAPDACGWRSTQVAPIKVQCCGGRERDEPAFVCQRFGRCLPGYNPQGDALVQWRQRQPEASIYHLCHGCESFRAVE